MTVPAAWYWFLGRMVIFISSPFFQNYTKLIGMYKVLLKIDRVSLKIKQTVQLHVVIKKDHKYFTHSKNQALRDGEAKLTNTSEFLIESKNPKFEIEIYLISGQTRKKGGAILINLKNYVINVSHRIVQQIRKTPLTHSSLSLDFVYMPSEYFFENEPLLSLQKMEEMTHKKHLKEITDEHQKLVYHNTRLNEEIRKLKEKNMDLSKETKHLEENIHHRQEQYSSQLKKMETEREKTYLNLEDQKKKVAEIMEIITIRGNPSLVKEMGKVINCSDAQTKSI